MRPLISKPMNSHHVTKCLADRLCKRPGCGRRFTKTRRWQCYCSPLCKELYWKELRAEAAKLMEAKRINQTNEEVKEL